MSSDAPATPVVATERVSRKVGRAYFAGDIGDADGGFWEAREGSTADIGSSLMAATGDNSPLGSKSSFRHHLFMIEEESKYDVSSASNRDNAVASESTSLSELPPACIEAPSESSSCDSKRACDTASASLPESLRTGRKDSAPAAGMPEQSQRAYRKEALSRSYSGPLPRRSADMASFSGAGTTNRWILVP